MNVSMVKCALYSRFVGVFLLLSASSLWGQLIQPGSPVPRTDKPPVVFLNGYQSDCTGVDFAGTFGTADQVLQANGRVTLFFNNCSVANHPALETVASAFATFLGALKYTDGTPVPTVDVVAHSMGGLILRSYLSGKQASGPFQPPAVTGVRKVVFLATPHFGTAVASKFGSDAQTGEIASGSRFIFDLATWNQGTDDLRGVDALAVAGNGGTGSSPFSAGPAGFDDGVVAITSASLGFVAPGRTRILPYCHIGGDNPLIQIAGLCPATAKGIAKIVNATDDNAKIMVSFLNGTTAWQSIGTAPEADPFLSKDSGLDVMAHDANDTLLGLNKVTAAGPSNTKDLNIQGLSVGYTDLLAAGAINLTSVTSSATITSQINLAAGSYRAVVVKPGPLVSGVLPAASGTFPLGVAPGSFMAIYGTALAGSTATAASTTYPTQLADVQVLVNNTPAPLYYASPAQINALVPDGLSGLVALMVKNTAGSQTVNVFVEPAVPSIFTVGSTGSGAAAALNHTNEQLVGTGNPLHAGEYMELYLTGLGATTKRGDGLDWANTQPTVTVGEQACNVVYAGRAPSWPGLDQINCLVPAVAANPAAPVIVTSGQRISNVATVVVQ